MSHFTCTGDEKTLNALVKELMQEVALLKTELAELKKRKYVKTPCIICGGHGNDSNTCDQSPVCLCHVCNGSGYKVWQLDSTHELTENDSFTDVTEYNKEL